eukprot:jgi/Bigna1/136131/aug1.32_g10839
MSSGRYNVAKRFRADFQGDEYGKKIMRIISTSSAGEASGGTLRSRSGCVASEFVNSFDLLSTEFDLKYFIQKEMGFIGVRFVSRKRRKEKARARLQQEADVFAQALREMAEMFANSPQLQKVADDVDKVMKERGVLRDVFGGGIEGRGALEIDPFPVREAFLESSTLLGKEEESADEEDLLDSSSSSPSSSSSSSSPSPRLIPDERVVIEDAKSPVESADGGGLRSLFASSSDERRESTRQLKNTMRSSRIKVLYDNEIMMMMMMMVIKGWNYCETTSIVLDVLWLFSRKELDVLATTLGHDSADFQNFREYINKKTFFDKAELSRGEEDET